MIFWSRGVFWTLVVLIYTCLIIVITLEAHGETYVPPDSQCQMGRGGYVLPLDDTDTDSRDLWQEYHFHDPQYLSWGGDQLVTWLIREYERNLYAHCPSSGIYIRDLGHIPTASSKSYLRGAAARWPGKNEVRVDARFALKLMGEVP